MWGRGKWFLSVRWATQCIHSTPKERALSVALDHALRVKVDRTARVYPVGKLGQLGENFFLCLLDVLDCHVNDEMYFDTVVIFVVILKGGC